MWCGRDLSIYRAWTGQFLPRCNHDDKHAMPSNEINDDALQQFLNSLLWKLHKQLSRATMESVDYSENMDMLICGEPTFREFFEANNALGTNEHTFGRQLVDKISRGLVGCSRTTIEAVSNMSFLCVWSA